jgi:glycosyltransferase involved in cell wall biosynthesis
MESMNNSVKVSVCVVTYNQEKYIRACLQSILDQETDFAFEVIVGDDASTDGTPGIVQEFAERYPNQVRAILRDVNIGPTQNYLRVHNLAKGMYIAHVDGDDYCLPGKLMRLASHLDSNPDCRIVWHRMRIINEHGKSAVGMPIVPIKNFIDSPRLYVKDLAKYYGLTGCHSGSMYRAAAKKVYAATEEKLDYFFTLSFCIDGGYASYIDDVYGVYRAFSTEMTLTKYPGRVKTGRDTIAMMKSYLTSNPELAKSFAAQCVLEIMVRTYLRYPLKLEFFKMLLACRTLPAWSDVVLVSKVFLANRNTKRRRAYRTTETNGKWV